MKQEQRNETAIYSNATDPSSFSAMRPVSFATNQDGRNAVLWIFFLNFVSWWGGKMWTVQSDDVLVLADADDPTSSMRQRSAGPGIIIRSALMAAAKAFLSAFFPNSRHIYQQLIASSLSLSLSLSFSVSSFIINTTHTTTTTPRSPWR